MATIVHQGIKLAYEDRGAGEPAFIFVHGWTCDRSFFTPQVEYFARQHRVVSVDLRGHGESDKPQGPYPISAYADDLAYMIVQLDLGKVVAVGHSMGGLAVLQLGVAHPDHVAAIVMVDPTAFVRSTEQQARIKAMVAAIEAGDQEPRRQFVVDNFLSTSDRELVEKVTTTMLATPSHVAANAMKGNISFDSVSAAAQCKMPALHIAATQPRNLPHLMSQWFPSVVNGWTVGTGHFNQLEAPDQVNAMIDAFLRHHL